MALRTLSIALVDFGLVAAADCRVHIELIRAGRDSGSIVIPTYREEIRTDVAGAATLQVWPNDEHSRYHVKIYNARGSVAVKGYFDMPEADVDLADIIVFDDQFTGIAATAELAKKLTMNSDWDVTANAGLPADPRNNYAWRLTNVPTTGQPIVDDKPVRSGQVVYRKDGQWHLFGGPGFYIDDWAVNAVSPALPDGTIKGTFLTVESISGGTSFVLADQTFQVGDIAIVLATDPAIDIFRIPNLGVSVGEAALLIAEAVSAHLEAVNPHSQYVLGNALGQANGVATLDANQRLVQEIDASKIFGVIPAVNLPAYVDDVLEFANLAAFPLVGASDVIYVALDTNKTYRWSGSAYIELGTQSVFQYANTAAFPVTGAGATLYIAADTGIVYWWNGAAYAIILSSLFGVPNGAATLDGSGVVPDVQLPSYAYANLAAFPPVGASGKIYLALDTGKLYTPIAGPAYQEVSAGLSAIATMTILGNNTVGSAVPTALTKTDVQTLLDIGWVLQIRSTATPNGTIPVHQIIATGAATNIDLAITAKGTGALLAQVPDNATTGGNKRGTRAVDLQRSRSAATQVASGQDSHIGGGTNNTASGTRATVFNGTNCTASGADSGAGGDSVLSSGQYSFSWGYSHSNAAMAAVAFGYDHTIGSNAFGAAAFGVQHTLNGRDSSAFGTGCHDNGSWGLHLISGYNSSSDVGRRQKAMLVLQAATIDATPLAFTYPGGGTVSDTSVLKIGNTASTIYIKGRVTARKSQAANQLKVWDVVAVIGNIGAGHVLLVDTVTEVYETAGATAWAIAATWDAANRRFTYTVTGEAAVSIDWVCDLDIHYGAIGIV